MNCCSDFFSFVVFFFFAAFTPGLPAGADWDDGAEDGAGLGLSTAFATCGSAMVKANAPPASNARAGQESGRESGRERADEIFVMNSLQAAVCMPAPRRFALDDDFRDTNNRPSGDHSGGRV